MTDTEISEATRDWDASRKKLDSGKVGMASEKGHAEAFRVQTIGRGVGYMNRKLKVKYR